MLAAVDLFGVAAIIAAIGGLMASLGTWWNGRRIREVHQEVTTSNGKTLAKLADLTEGRRIIADVPVDERNASQRAHVEEVKRTEEKEADSL